MEKLPTAEEFYLKKKFPTLFENRRDEVEYWFQCDSHAKEDVQIMIEFAKLHVEAQREALIEEVSKPHYVDFNTAKLLKEKGFSCECKAWYEGMTPSPQQWQVVEWASLVHNIDIESRPVRYAGDLKTSYYQPYINGCVVNMRKFATKQEALSEAINEFLKMI
jgi:hypothetical protein